MHNREAADANFVVFGLTWSGLEPTIYRIRNEHANYNATDAVMHIRIDMKLICSLLAWLFYLFFYFIFSGGMLINIILCRYSRWNRVEYIGIFVLNSLPIWTHYFLVSVFCMGVAQQSPNLHTLFSGSCVLNLCYSTAAQSEHIIFWFPCSDWLLFLSMSTQIVLRLFYDHVYITWSS